MVRFAVGIVRFQRGKGVGVRELRDWRGGNNGREAREGGMREGGGCVEGGKRVDKNSGG